MRPRTGSNRRGVHALRLRYIALWEQPVLTRNAMHVLVAAVVVAVTPPVAVVVVPEVGVVLVIILVVVVVVVVGVSTRCSHNAM